jgi:hypothetical protein
VCSSLRSRSGPKWVGWLALSSVGLLAVGLAVFGSAAFIWWLVPALENATKWLVLALVNAKSWLPKVPGVVARFFVSLAKFLALPVLAPIDNWKSIRKPNAAGDRTGVFVASLSTLWTFIVALFLWYFAVAIAILLAAYTYEAVR